MADGTDGGNHPDGWVCELLFETQRALSAVDSLGDIAETVTHTLVGASCCRVAWIRTNTTTRDAISVVALKTPSLAVRRETLDSGPTDSASDERAVVIRPPASNHEYQHLTEAYDLPSVSTTVTISIENDEKRYGVLTMCTDHGVLDGDSEYLSVLGTAIADRCWGLEQSTTLGRERRRIETVRSRMSHDLGNPVNITAGRLELASDSCENDHIDHAIDGLAKIESLAKETVEFVEAGQPIADPVELSLEDAVREAWRAVNPQDATLEVTDGAVRGDPERLNRLFIELIENAREHTEGRVSVRVGPLPDRSGFFVADDGPGIPADKWDSVFDLGYTTGDGNGIGLTVVAEIAAAHGWTITLSESSDGGTQIECRTDRL